MKSLPETGVGFKLKCVTGFVTKSCTVSEIRRICTLVGFVTLRQMRPTFPGNRQIELNEDHLNDQSLGDRSAIFKMM